MVKQLSKHRDRLWPWLMIIFGSIVSSLGYVIFILPLNMIEGGVTGIGIIVQHLTRLPIVGMSSLALTAVVFVVATKKLGKSFGAKSIFATILMNLLIDFFTILKIRPVTDDILLAAFYGGAIVGLGLGLIYYAGASTGGADALAQIFWRLRRIPIGRTLLTIDIFVLSAATIIFIPLEKIMYSLIFIYIEIQVIDMVISGFRASQRVMVVTDKPDEIKEAIFERLGRGLTIFRGEGGYTGEERLMLTTVVPKKDIPEVRRIISHHDPDAFVIIQDIHQVYGEGFDRLPKRGPVTDQKS